MKHRFFRTIFLTVLAAAFGIQGVAAEDADTQLCALNVSLLDGHVVARHRVLGAATANLQEAVAQFCADRSAANLDRAQDAFGAAVTGWAGVQHLGFSIQSFGMRNFRMQFWPDPKNRTGRRIAQYLRDEDTALLDPDRFQKTSVTIQGLPAMERLLYGEASTQALLNETEEGQLRCELAQAIAGNMAAIGTDLHEDWKRVDGFRREIAAPSEDGYFRTDAEVTNAYFSYLHDAIELVRDVKLARPMGGEAVKANPKKAEYWRSGNSLVSLSANLQAAREMWEGRDIGFRTLAESRMISPELVSGIDAAFDASFAALAEIETPLSGAVVNDRAKLARLAESLSSLRMMLRAELAPALGIVIGFNSRDGD